MRNRFIIAQIFILIVLVAMLIMYMRADTSSSTKAQPAIVVASSSPLQMSASDKADKGGVLVNPEVLLNEDKHYIINFKPLKDELSALQHGQKQKTYIYFAYLNNSSWIGLNEKDLFTAASTIKVPLAMSIYKMEEQGKLSSKDLYSLDQLDLDKKFGELYKAGPDNSFTVEELIGVMLAYSDNTAMQALFHVMNLYGISDPLADVYNAMGWEYNDIGTTPTYIKINLKTLANIFISLYNATYDNASNSQKILSYLTQSSFDSQIVAGVPQNIVVAHKIGYNGNDNTYSDCGIVYAPHRPYILCVGSSGAPQKTADGFISSVSSTVYHYVINN